MDIQLHPITKNNWEDCISLKVKGDQVGYVASNLYSLAESKFEPSFLPLGIYGDGEMIGFVMIGKDPSDQVDWILRYMIGQEHQEKGKGKAALDVILSYMSSRMDASRYLLLGVKPNNLQAKSLYEKAGFFFTGKLEPGEEIYRLDLL
ncbi:GNAT family N-acetyltransferase [Metabacillus indicus]|uniref:GNAT family N-acetyltransferase n=1 Tax=Metabacillus indicus TaxID=246786 RepID=UPI002A05F502|nr:GNAT family N-acetyltransferase [Metabacillus indicus]MDX8290931.1 GNAT family N-acetyltransferase [Metabacillus indicus]